MTRRRTAVTILQILSLNGCDGGHRLRSITVGGGPSVVVHTDDGAGYSLEGPGLEIIGAAVIAVTDAGMLGG